MLNVQKNLCCVKENSQEIIRAIKNIDKYRFKDEYFGVGNSDKRILGILENNDIWKIPIQKMFVSIW